jgi:hypothetical protein
MSDTAEATEEKPRRTSRLSLLVGVFLMLALGGGGFYAVYAGLILGHKEETAEEEAHAEALPDIAFVPVSPWSCRSALPEEADTCTSHPSWRSTSLQKRRSPCCCRGSLTS